MNEKFAPKVPFGAHDYGVALHLTNSTFNI